MRHLRSIPGDRPAIFSTVTLLLVACHSTNSTEPSDAGDDLDAQSDLADAIGVARAPDAAPTVDARPGDGGLQPDASALSCSPLPAPSEPIVRVTPQEADSLPQLAAAAAPGTTILLEDGVYRMSARDEGSRRIQLAARGLTLRSANGDAERVIIDGEYLTREMITVGADDITIAHLTIQHAIDHPIHVSPSSSGDDVTGTLIYGARILDGGEQFVKINSNGTRDAWADFGRIECSFFQLTPAGRPRVERASGGCYTGGIDAHGARGWVVRSNTFRDLYCAGEGLAEHAIHFWTGSRDTVVENNTIMNCARGIGFGLVESGEARSYSDDPYPDVGYVGHYDGLIRNNVIHSDIEFFDTGIELDQARGARVYHNTVVGAGGSFFSSIDYRFPNTRVVLRNNLTRRITMRNGAAGEVDHNRETTSLEDFADPARGDFHLVPGSAAIDQGVAVGDSGLDVDGEPHSAGAAPDLGADER
ncbi:MAG: right-handed parallel beta-helix repeat-containing protein [Deltaproteobacteria bacterium]|nr:right-handed parallel beta-helix repeat-containing protein [Deltaproteobacteria bacterium]